MRKSLLLLLAILPLSLFARRYDEVRTSSDLDINVEATGAVGTGDNLPYLLTQNRQGVLSPQGSQGYLRATADYAYRRNKFHVGAGADVIGYASTHYDYYRSAVYLQQLYAEVGYGKYYLELGSHEDKGNFVDPTLSSGNMIWSGNSRPVPGVRFGTRDFVSMVILANVFEAKVDCSFGMMLDGDYNNARFDQYTDGQGGLLRASGVDGAWIHRKSLFFRSTSQQPFYVTVGAEHVALYGGTIRHRDGDWDDAQGIDGRNTCSVVTYEQTGKWGNALTGGDGDPNDALNHAFAIDLRLDLNRPGFAIGLYKQHYADDLNASSFRHLADGLWGLELRLKRFRWLNHIVVEYLCSDAQGDDTEALRQLTQGEAPDADDYASDFYQDQRFGGYAYYGMACGNSLLTSPVYNTDGYTGYSWNIVRALQLAFEGQATARLSYRCKLAHLTSDGTPWGIALNNLSGTPQASRSATSLLIEASYATKGGLSLTPAVAFDSGKLYGSNFAVCLTARYTFGSHHSDYKYND